MSRLTYNLHRATAAATAAALLVTAPSPAFASEKPQPFSAPQDPASYDRALRCLTEAVYYEARSESEDGQRAVAQVVLNRVRHPSYPNSVCGVVYQGSHRQTGCQFTFTCDGSLGASYIDGSAWSRAERIAASALAGSVYRPVGLALNYHTTAIRPYWAPSLVRQAVIGAHIFYRRPDSGDVDMFRQSPAEIEPRAGGQSAFARRTIPTRGERAVTEARSGGIRQAATERTRVERPVVQHATVERPAIQSVVFERPVSSRISTSRRAATAAAKPQAQPVVRPSGSRTTMENGVRVARGS